MRPSIGIIDLIPPSTNGGPSLIYDHQMCCDVKRQVSAYSILLPLTNLVDLCVWWSSDECATSDFSGSFRPLHLRHTGTSLATLDVLFFS